MSAALANLAKARKLLGSARSNLGRAANMQPDCVTANRLRERAYRQEDEAHRLLDLVAAELKGISA